MPRCKCWSIRGPVPPWTHRCHCPLLWGSSHRHPHSPPKPGTTRRASGRGWMCATHHATAAESLLRTLCMSEVCQQLRCALSGHLPATMAGSPVQLNPAAQPWTPSLLPRLWGLCINHKHQSNSRDTNSRRWSFGVALLFCKVVNSK